MQDLPQDFRDLLIELSDADVEFVIIGGYAVAFHGHARATKDIDVLVRASPANSARVYKALAAFGAPLTQFEVTEDEFTDYDGVLQLGTPPFRIDILNSATAITFDEAIENRDAFELDGRRIAVIGLTALIKNKNAAARAQDIADVKALNRKHAER